MSKQQVQVAAALFWIRGQGAPPSAAKSRYINQRLPQDYFRPTFVSDCRVADEYL